MAPRQSEHKAEMTVKQPTSVVYTSESSLRHPGALGRAMITDLMAAVELARVLFRRNLRMRHRQSLLGYVWLFLPPVVTTLTWVFLNAAGLLRPQTTTTPYPLYVLTGTLLWQGFVDALNCPLNQLSSNRPLLSKVSFPREALILVGFAEALFNFAIRLLLLVVVYAVMRFPVPPTILLVPVGVLALMLFGLMLGLALAPFGLLFQDVQRGLGIIVSLWYFVTPIVYTPPDTYPFTLIARLNPVTPLLMTTRDWLTTGVTTQLNGFLLMTLLTGGGILVAWTFLRLAMPHLITRTLAR